MMVLALGLSIRPKTAPSPEGSRACPRPAVVVSQDAVVAATGLLDARTDIGLARTLDWPRTGGNEEPGDISPPGNRLGVPDRCELPRVVVLDDREVVGAPGKVP